MTVNKLGVNNDFSTEKNGENIIILNLLVQVTTTSFYQKDLIDDTLSAYIYSTLQQDGYLNSYGEVEDKLDPLLKFNLDFYGTTYPEANYSADEKTAIQNHIKKVLVFSRIEYPIRFFVQSSLKFNFASTTSSRLLANSGVIQTPSTQVKIYMQIEKNGKFVKKQFDGVLTSFSDDLSSVQISGQTSYVDAIISNSILIANSTEDLSKVIVYTLLSDSSNYDITLTVGLDKLSFVSLHRSVELDKTKRLQD